MEQVVWTKPQAMLVRGIPYPFRKESFGVDTFIIVQMSSAPAALKISRARSHLSGFSVWTEMRLRPSLILPS